jgi:soluble lytic murein transglycosylase-like protein
MLTRSPFFATFLVLAVLVGAADSFAKSRGRSRRHIKKAAKTEEPKEEVQAAPFHVRLLMVDGSRVDVDEAWESDQGIWYRKSGVSYLGTRDRVKQIERGDLAGPVGNEHVNEAPRPIAPAPVDNVATANQATPNQSIERAWIHLNGGARMEAEHIEESAAGVWYRRGSLAIFIDRSRIDHIEREELEKSGESDSSTKQLRWSSGNSKIDALIKQNGAKYGVDPYLIFCVMEQESHFNSRVVSPKGAAGLMQLMPGTSARFGVRHPFSPAENISAGTRYLKQLMTKFNGRVDLVLAGYNAGEGAVVRFGHRVPPYSETRNYVKQISYRYRKAKGPAKTPATKAVATNAQPQGKVAGGGAN